MAEEKNFENRIKKYLETKKAWHVKYFANRNTKSGVPDILACIGGHFVAIEVKAPKGKPSPLQVWNVEKIREAGGIALIVYPSDWENIKTLIDDLSEKK
jgi:Holliday junction resolvase